MCGTLNGSRLTVAPTATPYTTRAVPSFTRLSARRTVMVRRGSDPASAPTAVASVGATAAPRTQAGPQPRPRACTTAATAAAVAITSAVLFSTMTRRLLRISRSEIVRVSQYRSAGRNSSRTTSGGRRTWRSAGAKPSTAPQASSSTGAATPKRRATTPQASTTAPSATTSSRPSTMFLPGGTDYHHHARAAWFSRDQSRSWPRIRASSARSAGLRRPKTRPASGPRVPRISAIRPVPCSVTSTRVARRSPGSARRRTRSRDSSASTTSVAVRGAISRCSESSDSRIVPCLLSARRARRWAGVMPHGASVSADLSRSWRATAPKASASDSSLTGSVPPGSGDSGPEVTGIEYQGFVLYPHSEVTSPINLPLAKGNPLGNTPNEPGYPRARPEPENRHRRGESAGTRGVAAPHRAAVPPLPVAAGHRYRHHRGLLGGRAGLAVPAPRGDRHRPAGAERKAAGLAGHRHDRGRRHHLGVRRHPDLDQHQGRPARHARAAHQRLHPPAAPVDRLLHPHPHRRGAIPHPERHRRHGGGRDLDRDLHRLEPHHRGGHGHRHGRPVLAAIAHLAGGHAAGHHLHPQGGQDAPGHHHRAAA